MAKKAAKKEVEVVKETTEKIVEAPPMNTMVDQNGYTWEIDEEGKKLRRV